MKPLASIREKCRLTDTCTCMITIYKEKFVLRILELQICTVQVQVTINKSVVLYEIIQMHLILNNENFMESQFFQNMLAV